MERKLIEDLSDEQRDELGFFKYKLCYVNYSDTKYDENNETKAHKYDLYFTLKELEELWDDSWEIAPWETFSNPPQEKVYDKDGKVIENPTLILELWVDSKNYLLLPPPSCSIQDINSGACSWLYYPARNKKCNGIGIYAGMTPKDIWAKIGQFSIKV